MEHSILAHMKADLQLGQYTHWFQVGMIADTSKFGPHFLSYLAIHAVDLSPIVPHPDDQMLAHFRALVPLLEMDLQPRVQYDQCETRMEQINSAFRFLNNPDELTTHKEEFCALVPSLLPRDAGKIPACSTTMKQVRDCLVAEFVQLTLRQNGLEHCLH